MYSDILASGAVSQLGMLAYCSSCLFSLVLDVILSIYPTQLEYFTAAYYNQELVGAIACRLELHGDDAKLYIITLGVLAPYRGMRVGA